MSLTTAEMLDNRFQRIHVDEEVLLPIIKEYGGVESKRIVFDNSHDIVETKPQTLVFYSFPDGSVLRRQDVWWDDDELESVVSAITKKN